MHFKMIIVLIEDDNTEAVMNAAREAGATGATVISHARGEGIESSSTFLGLTLDSQRDVILLLVEEHLSRNILEEIERVGEFEAKPGSGIAFQIDVEDAVGVQHQISKLSGELEDQL